MQLAYILQRLVQEAQQHPDLQAILVEHPAGSPQPELPASACRMLDMNSDGFLHAHRFDRGTMTYRWQLSCRGGSKADTKAIRGAELFRRLAAEVARRWSPNEANPVDAAILAMHHAPGVQQRVPVLRFDLPRMLKPDGYDYGYSILENVWDALAAAADRLKPAAAGGGGGADSPKSAKKRGRLGKKAAAGSKRPPQSVPDGFYSPTDIAEAMSANDKTDAIRMALKRLFDEGRLPGNAWLQNNDPAWGQATILYRLSSVRPFLARFEPSARD